VCLTLLKKNKNGHAQSSSDYKPTGFYEDSKAFSDEPINQLYDGIRQLSEIDRAVILLYLEEKSHQEIADIIDTNASNIGTRVKRIKERLKKILDGKVN
jgi:RNA polymerase sigma-70 factor (ECF subfamily)